MRKKKMPIDTKVTFMHDAYGEVQGVIVWQEDRAGYDKVRITSPEGYPVTASKRHFPDGEPVPYYKLRRL